MAASGSPTPHPHEPAMSGTVHMPLDQSAIDAAQERVMEAVTAAGYAKATLFAVRLAMHEAVSNAFRHGHEGLPDETTVGLTWRVTPAEVSIAVQDQGPGFVPQDVPDPTLEENLERGSGRGLLLIRAYMTSAEYADGGRRLEMTYRRPET
jgi:serine/threonine-protein kinase RsbW